MEVLIKKADVKRDLISKHWEEEVIHHILQGNHELTNREKECMKRGALTAYQVLETLSVSKTPKVPGNRHCLQNTGAIQTAYKLFIRKFPILLGAP